MRKILLAGAAGCALLGATDAHAQVGGLCTTADGPCSSFPEQLLQYTEQGLQLNQETITAVQEYTSALPLTYFAFQDLTGEITAIADLATSASMLAGNTLIILTDLNALGGGISTANLTNWHQAMTNDANAVGLAMQVCAKANMLVSSFANEAALFTNFVNAIEAVIGRQQSLQNISQQTSQLAQTIRKIGAETIPCRQASATFQAAQQHRQYVFQEVNDHDNDITSVNECGIVAQLGFVPAGCGGEYPAGSQLAALAAAGGGIIGGSPVAGSTDQDFAAVFASEEAANQNFSGGSLGAASAATGATAAADQSFSGGAQNSAATTPNTGDDSATADQALGTAAAETPAATNDGGSAATSITDPGGAID
jgi:hypothetical protein